MRTTGFIIILFFIILIIELYVYQSLKLLIKNLGAKKAKLIITIHWIIAGLCMATFLYLQFSSRAAQPETVRTYLLSIIFAVYLSKFFGVIFLFIDDIRRLILKIIRPKKAENSGTKISRSKFLNWVGLSFGGVMFGSLMIGFKNKYNYKIFTHFLGFNNLPKAFKGLKIVQISDIHSGSLKNKEAVAKGVELIMQQKPDIILFTGDLVNLVAEEFEPLKDIFKPLNAPLGVYSIMGNHDYGDYYNWEDKTPEQKKKDFETGRTVLSPLQKKNIDYLQDMQRSIGWIVLNDENVILEKDGEKIALIGVQNITGKGKRFQTYGNMAKAYEGVKDIPFKILMSHDPSHWDTEVVSKYTDIDLTLAGHTHGMQFGIEIPGLKWSPSRFMFKHWAGLYKQGSQMLYVNRGFGFIGYPGRVGIMPEITVLNLG